MQETDIKFSFGEVEDAMMMLLEISEARRMALRSRIQYLQRQGFLEQGGQGRGHRVSYTEEAARKLALVLHFARSGLPSQLAIRLVERHWDAIAEKGVMTSRTEGLFAIFEPEAMSELGKEGRSSIEILSGLEVAGRFIAGGASLAISAVVIDISTLFENLRLVLLD